MRMIKKFMFLVCLFCVVFIMAACDAAAGTDYDDGRVDYTYYLREDIEALEQLGVRMEINTHLYRLQRAFGMDTGIRYADGFPVFYIIEFSPIYEVDNAIDTEEEILAVVNAMNNAFEFLYEFDMLPASSAPTGVGTLSRHQTASIHVFSAELDDFYFDALRPLHRQNPIFRESAFMIVEARQAAIDYIGGGGMNFLNDIGAGLVFDDFGMITFFLDELLEEEAIYGEVSGHGWAHITMPNIEVFSIVSTQGTQITLDTDEAVEAVVDGLARAYSLLYGAAIGFRFDVSPPPGVEISELHRLALEQLLGI